MAPFPFIKLTSSSGAFGLDVKEYTLEWVILTHDVHDHATAIAIKGMVNPTMPLTQFGQAMGWYPPGTPYRIGNESNVVCYAGPIEVYGRKPIRGSGDFTIRGVRIVRTQNAGPLVKWNVRQHYSTSYDKSSDRQTGSRPSVNDKVTITVNYEWEEMPLVRDIVNGTMVLNSAGQPFTTPAKRRRKIPVYSITRREIFNPIAKANNFSNTVNGSPYFGAAPYTLLMDSIIPHFDGNIWKVTYNIKERVEGWRVKLLDTGYNERLPDGSLTPILDDVNTPVSEPAKLDGNGIALEDQTAPGTDVGPYHRYLLTNFAALNLPNPFRINAVPDQYF